MKTPIPLPVKSVHVRHTAPGDWSADVTFGIPTDCAHDDPTITINSGEGLELPPKAGEIMMVRPPEIIGRVDYCKCESGPLIDEMPMVAKCLKCDKPPLQFLR